MSNNAQIPVGPQPDFRLMSQNCQTFTDEVAKIPNIPQFALGYDILARLDQINERLNTAVGEINTTIRANDRNNVARISNSSLTTSNDALTELVNPSNNTEVAGFPETPGHIGTMQAPTLTEVLRQLGLGVGGNRSANEQRLRVFIGLKKNPA